VISAVAHGNFRWVSGFQAGGDLSMKKSMRFAAPLLLIATLVACGGSSPTSNIDGGWFAQLNNPDASSAFQFSATLTQGSGTAVSVANFAFANSTLCFSSQTGETVTFSATGSSNGIVTGTFEMTISTVFPALNNVVNLQGTRNSDGSITGVWTLTGQSGCTGSGTFTMNLPHSDPP
jgi:hypothetical protein